MKLLLYGTIDEIQNAQKAKYFDRDAVADRVSTKRMTSSSFMTKLETYERCKTDTTIAGQSRVITETLKREPMAATGV